MAEPEKPRPKWNYRRRAVGALVCLAPAVLPFASLAVGPPTSEVGARVLAYGIGPGLGVVLVGFLVALLNAHLALVRPFLYRCRHGSLEGMRYVSGLGGIGSLAVFVGCALAFGHRPTAAFGLLVLTLDVGGLPWFLLVTWRESSVWDE